MEDSRQRTHLVSESTLRSTQHLLLILMISSFMLQPHPNQPLTSRLRATLMSRKSSESQAGYDIEGRAPQRRPGMVIEEMASEDNGDMEGMVPVCPWSTASIPGPGSSATSSSPE